MYGDLEKKSVVCDDSRAWGNFMIAFMEHMCYHKKEQMFDKRKIWVKYQKVNERRKACKRKNLRSKMLLGIATHGNVSG